MTALKQRIAIAELLGATWKHAFDNGRLFSILTFADNPDLSLHRWDIGEGRFLGQDIWNYPIDLNAIHKAEKALILTRLDQDKYLMLLHAQTQDSFWSICCADAAVRCAALVKLKGRWIS